MNEFIFFESFGTVVIGIRFQRSSDRVVHFNIVQALDYPEIDHDSEDNEVAKINYYNLLGADGEVVTEFNDANLVASGNIVIQYPEDTVNPITYTVEFQSGIVYNGLEFHDLATFINEVLPMKAYGFLQGNDLGSVELVQHDFS